jgi:hypothetical protein
MRASARQVAPGKQVDRACRWRGLAAAVLASATAALAPPHVAQAQVSMSGAVGITSGVSRIGSYLPSGPAAELGLGWRPHRSPVTLRLTGGYARLDANRYALGVTATGADLWSAPALAEIAAPVRDAARLRPFLAAGGGVQHRSSIGSIGMGYTLPALTLGVGTEYRLSTLALTVEWRVSAVSTHAGREVTMPLLLGVRRPLAGTRRADSTRSVPAADSPDPADPPARRWSFGTWAGYASGVWSGPPLGGAPDRGLVLSGVRLAWPLTESRAWRLDYTADLLPVVLMTRTVLATGDDRLTGNLSEQPRGTVYGAGIVPIGALGARRIAGDWWATLGASSGLVGFTEEVPLPGARKLNFLVTGAAGIEAPLGRHLRLSAGRGSTTSPTRTQRSTTRAPTSTRSTSASRDATNWRR